MSHRFITSLQQFNDLAFHPFPVKATKLDRAVRVDGTTVAVATNGKLFCTAIKSGRYAYSGMPDYAHAIAECCIRLGLLDEATTKAFLQSEKQKRARRQARHAAIALTEHAEQIGLKLTESQKRRVKDLTEIAA